MNLEKIKIVYLLGIGGIGMSALARYFNLFGMQVSGYDKTPTSLTRQLQEEGISVHFEDTPEQLPAILRESGVAENVLVIYTPAIPKNHVQFNLLKDKGYRMYKRSEVLGIITQNTSSIAVAGTHGKTTTSTMIAHVIKHSGKEVSAFLGGISGNYNTNLLLDQNAELTVIEADEYDRSFLRLFPYIGVITSMDADHLDIYGTAEEMIRCYQEFAGQVKESGILVYKHGLPINYSKKHFTYGFHEEADYRAINVQIIDGDYCFDLETPKGNVKGLKVGLPGRHNVENAVATYAACDILGIGAEKIKEGLVTYRGVKRRFEYIIKTADLVLVDDYAHHPAELTACINSIREMYPGKKILGIFQPHLFSRTRDFADEFAASLDLLDEAVLLDIYPARELPIEGVTAQMLLDKMKKPGKLIGKEELTDYVKSRNAGVVVTLGAGDIDKMVEPIKNALLT
jgi:UDP-N-acetylmuramate--alanine ligase